MNLSLKVTLNKLYSNVVIVAIPLPKCGNLLILLFFFLEQVYLTKVNRNVTVSKTFNAMAIFIFFKMFLYAQDLFHGQF